MCLSFMLILLYSNLHGFKHANKFGFNQSNLYDVYSCYVVLENEFEKCWVGQAVSKKCLSSVKGWFVAT